MRIAIVDPSGFTLPYDHCLAASLAQQACQVLLVTSRLSPGPWHNDATYERWEHFYRIANRLNKIKIRTCIKGFEHPFDMNTLSRRLVSWKPSIIHFQWLPFPAVDRFFLPRLRKIAPLVLTVHDTEPFHGSPSSRFQLVGLLSAFRHFDNYIVHTQYSKEVLVRKRALPERLVVVIPHGVLTYYRGLAADLKGSGHDIRFRRKKKVLFFGVIKPYKGVDLLLKAFARLPEPIAENAVLQIVGYPRMPVEPFRFLACRLGIERNVFWDLRFLGEKEVATYFAQADLVVLPYRKIDQSGVLMTALAFGKPIIASRLSGLAETIEDGVNGILVKPYDVEDLAQALTRVLGDDELRSRMASSVERLADGELSWESVAEKSIRLYQEILNRRMRKPRNSS